MPERVACQSALAWARRPRRLTPLPWPSPRAPALEAAEDGHVEGLQVRRASWREEAQYDVNFSFMAVIVASLAWMLAVSQRRIHACSSLLRIQHVVQCGYELQDRGRRDGPAVLRRDVVSAPPPVRRRLS